MVEALGCTEPAASAAWLTAADGAAAIDARWPRSTCSSSAARCTRPHVAALIARAKALGKRVLFDVDDLIFDDRYTHLIMETLDQQSDETGLQFWFGRLSAAERRCGSATARLRRTSCWPSGSASSQTSRPGWSRTFSTVRSSRSRPRSGRRSAQPDRAHARIRLGYFSGTPTHNRDFAIVEPALDRLLDEDPRLELRVVGFPPPSGRLARYGDRIETLPLQDFLNLQLIDR